MNKFYKIRVNPPGIWHSVSQIPATWLGDSDGTRACGGVPLLLYEAPGLLSAVGLGSAQHWGLQNSLSRTSSHLCPQDPDPSPGPGSWQEEQGILGDRGSGLLTLVPSLLCYSSGECWGAERGRWPPSSAPRQVAYHMSHCHSWG